MEFLIISAEVLAGVVLLHAALWIDHMIRKSLGQRESLLMTPDNVEELGGFLVDGSSEPIKVKGCWLIAESVTENGILIDGSSEPTQVKGCTFTTRVATCL